MESCAKSEGVRLARRILASAWLIMLSQVPEGTDPKIDEARRVFLEVLNEDDR